MELSKKHSFENERFEFEVEIVMGGESGRASFGLAQGNSSLVTCSLGKLES